MKSQEEMKQEYPGFDSLVYWLLWHLAGYFPPDFEWGLDAYKRTQELIAKEAETIRDLASRLKLAVEAIKAGITSCQEKNSLRAWGLLSEALKKIEEGS